MRDFRVVGFATVLIVLLVAAPFPFANEMETETLEVIGEAIIYNQDIVAAKEAALEDAFRIAVTRTRNVGNRRELHQELHLYRSLNLYQN